MRPSLLSRLPSSSSSSPSAHLKRPKLKNISARHRARALAEARSALTDYLHSTRSLPFSVADLISTHSPFSLSLLLSRLPSPPSPSPSLLPSLLRQFLSYRPVNEFDFFSESIGLPPLRPLPSPSPFLSDHPLLVPSVSALSQFGFPWSRLGLLSPAFLGCPPDRLLARLRSFEALGLRRVSVIGICLAFPWVLEDAAREEADALLGDLKEAFVDRGLDAAAGEDVEGVYEICRRIRVFYDAGAAKGGMGALMGRERRVFLEVGEEALRRKLEFFLRLGMRGEEVGVFVLENGEVFDMDLEGVGISVPEYLVGLGLGEEEAGELLKRYPHVMGKNRMGNLPGILRAVDLHGWFVDEIAGGNLRCLRLDCDSVAVGSGSEKLEAEFLEDVARMKDVKKQEQVDNKLEFFFSIGFGKNKITSKVVSRVNGTRDQLQERFDCLLEMGIEYSTLCRMVSATPKLLNQSTESIREKVDYLLNDLGYTLQYLNSFPAFLCFDLENRIKPRFNIMNWLKENGLVKKQFSPATILANAERRFVINLYGIHPAAPKQWLEVFSSRSDHHGNQRNLFCPKE